MKPAQFLGGDDPAELDDEAPTEPGRVSIEQLIEEELARLSRDSIVQSEQSPSSLDILLSVQPRPEQPEPDRESSAPRADSLTPATVGQRASHLPSADPRSVRPAAPSRAVIAAGIGARVVTAAVVGLTMGVLAWRIDAGPQIAASSPATQPRAAALVPPNNATGEPPAKAQERLSDQRATLAIEAAARDAQGCLAKDDTQRTMTVRVTFAPSGRVTRATVETGAHRGADAGECIAKHLRSATVGPFAGPPITVVTSLRVR